MDERASGIILRTRPLTETSLIVHWLTPELGRVATVAKGARRAKSPFRGKLDLFYRADFSFARSRRSELHTLREVNLHETHSALRRNLGLLQQASYAAALVEQTTETETPLPEIYSLFADVLSHLTREALAATTVFAFELKLLATLGLQPDWERSSLTPGSRQVVERLTRDDWATLGRLRLSAAQVRELRQFLHGFLIFHLGKIPFGRSMALGSGDP